MPGKSDARIEYASENAPMLGGVLAAHRKLGLILKRTASLEITVSLFMIVEHFRGGNAAPVYRRFKENGRMAPAGVTYISSWVDENLATCYQVMEAPDRALLDEWMRKWQDLVEFEVHPVITSPEAAQRVAALGA